MEDSLRSSMNGEDDPAQQLEAAEARNAENQYQRNMLQTQRYQHQQMAIRAHNMQHPGAIHYPPMHGRGMLSDMYATNMPVNAYVANMAGNMAMNGFMPGNDGYASGGVRSNLQFQGVSLMKSSMKTS